jgi:hypothetical protein
VVAALAAACGSSAVTNVTGPTAARCQLALTNSASSFSSSGGTGELKITVARECAWSSSTTAAWIEILSGKDGQGEGVIAYRVNANADPIARKGTIAIAEQQAEVAQQAAACRYTISAPAEMLAASGGRTAIDVRTHSACEWTAASDASWVNLEPASGRGDGTIDVEAGPNSGQARAVTITIGPDRVVVHQRSAPAAPPPPGPDPTPAPAPAPAPTPAPAPAPAPAPTPPPTTPPPPPAPMPAPAPPPPPPPPPTVVDVSGRVDDVRGSCPNLTFELKNYVVRTNNATTFSRGPCRDLRDGKDITMRGTRQSDGSLVATRIEFR